MTFDREKSAGYMTNWAARLFARTIDRRLRGIGVSSGMLPVFFALGGGAALPQKALALAGAIEQPTMAALLARMERDGLIERRPDPSDGRSRLIALTPAAMEKALRVREAVAAVNGIALRDLDDEGRASLLGLLKTVTATLEQALREEN
jgi:MarR family transcriptional regulator for hemolysin